MTLYIGTSGFSYPEWRGSFYPEGLAAGRFLEAYAARLNAVEVNNTFQRLPIGHPPPAAIRGVGEDGKQDQEHEFFG